MPWTRGVADDGSGEQPPGPAYGIGLVSRLPVLSWRVRRSGRRRSGCRCSCPAPGLTHVPDEPRVALAAVIETAGRADDGDHRPPVVRAGLERARSCATIARWARSLPAPRLLLGDLNLPGAVPRLVTGWTQLARVPTYPSWRPRVQFDHVLADTPMAVTAVQALRLPVSDHCALVVDLDDTRLIDR